MGNNASASNNALSVANGGALNNVGSVLMGGTSNNFNLGSGGAEATSTATVGTVTLGSSGAGLNINNGRLIANAAGTLVSGSTGVVTLNGAAYISTTYSSTISSQVTGTGSLTKEGLGTLDLSNVSNAYSGDTTVVGGSLIVRNLFLGDSSTVSVASGTTLDLETSGSDTINALYLGGTQVAAGVWGAVGSSAPNQSSLITGAGELNVLTGVPEPAAALLGSLGLLTILRRRWACEVSRREPDNPQSRGRRSGSAAPVCLCPTFSHAGEAWWAGACHYSGAVTRASVDADCSPDCLKERRKAAGRNKR